MGQRAASESLVRRRRQFFRRRQQKRHGNVRLNRGDSGVCPPLKLLFVRWLKRRVVHKKRFTFENNSLADAETPRKSIYSITDVDVLDYGLAMTVLEGRSAAADRPPSQYF
jgi:hypothetical protein